VLDIKNTNVLWKLMTNIIKLKYEFLKGRIHTGGIGKGRKPKT
jgi:hypothetical protein